MFNFQLYEALETYIKWLDYYDEELPLSALLVLLHQWQIILLIAVMSMCLTFDMANAFLAHLTNQVRFFCAFDQSQHSHGALDSSPLRGQTGCRCERWMAKLQGSQAPVVSCASKTSPCLLQQLQ